MKRTEQLFYLIQSLTKSEKRYFKVFASRHVIGNKNSYIKLFDLIVKQKEYDEAAIKKKLVNDENLRKNLSTIKVQLATLVLKSLRQYKSSLYKRYELRELMDFAHILYDKGLHDYSARTLEKAKKLAKDYDAFIYLDEITSFEHMLVTKNANYEQIEHFLDVTRLEGRKFRNFNEILATYEELESQIQFLTLKFHRIRSLHTAARFDEVMTHEYLKKVPEDQPLLCQVKYHAIWADYYYVTRNGEKCVPHIEAVIALLERQPHVISDTPEEYVKYFKKYMNYTGSFGYYDAFDEAATKLEVFAESVAKEKFSINLTNEILSSIYNMKLSTWIERGDFKEGLKIAKEFEVDTRLSELFSIPSQEMVIRFNMSYVFLGMGDYKSALKSINLILSTNYNQLRIDCQGFTRILNIILHFELGHYELIDSLIKNTSRFLKSRNRDFGFELLFLRFAKNCLTVEKSKQNISCFEDFRDELLILFNDPKEAIVLYYFDVIRWLDCQIKGDPFSEGEITKRKIV